MESFDFWFQDNYYTKINQGKLSKHFDEHIMYKLKQWTKKSQLSFLMAKCILVAMRAQQIKKSTPILDELRICQFIKAIRAINKR